MDDKKVENIRGEEMKEFMEGDLEEKLKDENWEEKWQDD